MKRFYGPKIRISSKTSSSIKKFNKLNHTNIPNPKTNPIVVNNICTSEFDYTGEY